ncbi:signal peptidase I [Patescibacteria group bacterium]|nr:signal peptidase I [Patescibacteria group bacterium]
MSEENQTGAQNTPAETPAPKIKVVKKDQSFWELLRFGVIALLVVLGVRTYIVQPFIVSGSSMVPTFKDGQYLIIDEISYKLSEPKRDDVIVFHYPKDPTKFFIKRIIGLPNETVDVKGNDVKITNNEHKDGFTLKEPYVENISSSQTHLVLGENEYFVMGDNRPASSDSRYWGGVDKSLIVGRVLLRLWPMNSVDVWPGKYTQIN